MLNLNAHKSWCGIAIQKEMIWKMFDVQVCSNQTFDILGFTILRGSASVKYLVQMLEIRY